MKTTITHGETPLLRAQIELASARTAYNAAWRKDPTAKGYPAVDKALAALNEAEEKVRQLTPAR